MRKTVHGSVRSFRQNMPQNSRNFFFLKGAFCALFPVRVHTPPDPGIVYRCEWRHILWFPGIFRSYRISCSDPDRRSHTQGIRHILFPHRGRTFFFPWHIVYLLSGKKARIFRKKFEIIKTNVCNFLPPVLYYCYKENNDVGQT